LANENKKENASNTIAQIPFFRFPRKNPAKSRIPFFAFVQKVRKRIPPMSSFSRFWRKRQIQVGGKKQNNKKRKPVLKNSI